MSIRKTGATPTNQSKPADGTPEARKSKAKSLMVKLGVGAGIAVLGAATGGTALVARLGTKLLPKVAQALPKVASLVPGKAGQFLSSKAGTLAATGSTATAGTALASSLSAAKGVGVAQDVKDLAEGKA